MSLRTCGDRNSSDRDVVLSCNLFILTAGREMVALWALADVALVTSLREGVNLGAMEFVACQQSSMHGVLLYR